MMNSIYLALWLGTDAFDIWIREALLIRRGKKYLHKLPVDEKIVLSKFLSNKAKTYCFNITQGELDSLSRKRIIYRATSLSQGYTPSFDFNLNDWAWDYLNLNKDLIELTQDEKKIKGVR